MKEKEKDKKKNPLIHSVESPFQPHYLNEWWMKKNNRLTRKQCIELGKRLDEGWSIQKNTKEFIHIIYRTEQQLLPIGVIMKTCTRHEFERRKKNEQKE